MSTTGFNLPSTSTNAVDSASSANPVPEAHAIVSLEPSSAMHIDTRSAETNMSDGLQTTSQDLLQLNRQAYDSGQQQGQHITRTADGRPPTIPSNQSNDDAMRSSGSAFFPDGQATSQNAQTAVSVESSVQVHIPSTTPQTASDLPNNQTSSSNSASDPPQELPKLPPIEIQSHQPEGHVRNANVAPEDETNPQPLQGGAAQSDSDKSVERTKQARHALNVLKNHHEVSDNLYIQFQRFLRKELTPNTTTKPKPNSTAKPSSSKQASSASSVQQVDNRQQLSEDDDQDSDDDEDEDDDDEDHDDDDEEDMDED